MRIQDSSQRNSQVRCTSALSMAKMPRIARTRRQVLEAVAPLHTAAAPTCIVRDRDDEEALVDIGHHAVVRVAQAPPVMLGQGLDGRSLARGLRDVRQQNDHAAVQLVPLLAQQGVVGRIAQQLVAEAAHGFAAGRPAA